MLKYIGDETWRGSVAAAEQNGGRVIARPFFPGAPARDLTDDEIAELKLDKAMLLRSGLYQEIGAPTATRKSAHEKEVNNG